MPLLRLTPVLLAAALLRPAAPRTPRSREAFRPPPAGALQDGPCGIVADDVVELGRLAFALRGRPPPTTRRQRRSPPPRPGSRASLTAPSRP